MHWLTNRFSLLIVILAMTFTDLIREGSCGPAPRRVLQNPTTNQTQSSTNNPPVGRLEKKPPLPARENSPIKSRAEILGAMLRRLLRKLKEGDDPRLELVFLVDASTSVGVENFFNEIRFVRKLLSDFTVSSNAIRVALVTFSSRNRVIRHIDHISSHSSGDKNHKCSLMQEEFPRITYTGGGTYTLGAMLEAEAIIRQARKGVRRAVFLITDGYSNGGDPRPVAQRLKEMRSTRGSQRHSEGGADNKEDRNEGRRKTRNGQLGVEIFTFGIKNGNTEELLAMATDREHTFIVGSFREFEALGRRAFHQDLQIGSFQPVNATMCNKLCTHGSFTNGSRSNESQCCDMMGECACGTVSGHYSCICPPGHYGTGLKKDCHPCPLGTYNPGGFPGDKHLLCRRCPDPNHSTVRVGSTSVDDCICGEGYVPSHERPMKCIAITCPPLKPPLNGYFTRTISGKRNARRRLNRVGQDRQSGSNRRIQSGSRESCPSLTYKSTCGVRCKTGFVLIGSHIRTCGPNGSWTGHDASCVIKKCPPLQQPKDGIIHCEQKFGSVKGNMSTHVGPKDGFLPNTICKFSCNHGYHLVGSAKRTCLPSGIWDGLQVYCKAKSCPSLQSLPHGKVFPPTCMGRQHHSLIVTSCLLVCNPGYILWGVRDRLDWETNQAKLVCGPDGNWELTNTEIASTKEAMAWKRGKWNGGRCVDVEPPALYCPHNITVGTDKDKKYSTVYWDQPNATDNSGIPVTLNVIPALSWPAKFPIGENEVTIMARDANRNKVKCKFTVSVIDDQPPTVHACESPPPFILPSEPPPKPEYKSHVSSTAHALKWNTPIFEDNSGHDVKVKVEAQMSGTVVPSVWEGLEGGQGEVFLVGDSTVIYTASDKYGNNNTCKITITIREHACPELPDPIHGSSNCSQGRAKDSTSLLCTLTCSEGYAFPVSTPQEYFCSSKIDGTLNNLVSTGQFKSEKKLIHVMQPNDSSNTAMAIHKNDGQLISWEPHEILPFADCMVAAIPNTLTQDGLIFMDGDNSVCNDSVFFEQVEDTIRKKISEKLAEICGTGSIGLQCEIIGEIEQVCDSLKTTPEKEMNIMMASSVPQKDEMQRGKGGEGRRAQKDRRNGSGRGLQRRKLRDEVRGSRGRKGGAAKKQLRKGGEGRGGGWRKRDHKGGMQRKNGKSSKHDMNVELQPRQSMKQPGADESLKKKKADLHETGRKRRNVNEHLNEDSSEISNSGNEKEIDEDDDYDYEDSSEPEKKMPGIGIYFKMVGQLKNGSKWNQLIEESALRTVMESAQEKLQKAVMMGNFDLNVTIWGNSSDDGEPNISIKKLTSSIGFEPPHKGCDKGSLLINNVCVKCPSGTHWNEFSEECVVCEKGTYQPEEGQGFCHSCPEGFSTNVGVRNRSRRKAISIIDCIVECSPGTYSVDGLIPCSTCSKGYFMPFTGAVNCTKCPENFTTTARGAITLHECLALCSSGTISETGSSPCFQCPSSYFQNEPGKTFCIKKSCSEDNCESITSTSTKFTADGEDNHDKILHYNDCFTLPCHNGGTCIPLPISGYFCSCDVGFMGTFCELKEDVCESEPCLNNGNCSSSSSGMLYTCSCTQGYTGLNCEEVIDECSPSPCLNNAVCVTHETSFECLCSPEFEGILCEKEVCHSASCIANDSCIFDGENWECICGSESSEDECTAEEVKMLEDKLALDDDESLEMMSDSVLHFPRSDTTNYILITGNMDKNYTKITLCGWMNSKDHSNYGTVFSLATSDSDNAFVLTDYSGFVIYVGGNSAVTDVSANDGKWHHFCLSWSSRYGNWQFFYDGNLTAKGENLSAGYSIPGHATIVLGQEQDWVGGGFSEMESFVGRLTLLTIENNIISAEEAFQRATLCKAVDRDSLIWDWADFLTAIHGKIEVESSNLCLECIKPSPPRNGQVVLFNKEDYPREHGEARGLMIKYTCQTGFTLHKGQEFRKCLSNGTWDGKQPSCKRASCDSLESEVLNAANGTTLSIKCKGRKKADNRNRELNKAETDEKFDYLYNHKENKNLHTASKTSVSTLNKTSSVFNVNVSYTINNTNGDYKTESFNVPNEGQYKSIGNETKCLGPLGIGKLNGKWTSYSEAHKLLTGLHSNNHNQKQFLFTLGTKLDIGCDDGFELKGVNELVCGPEGKWKKRLKYASEIDDTMVYEEGSIEEGEAVPLPSCNPVKCGSPPDIHQGAWELMERRRWNGGEGLRWHKVQHGYESGETEIAYESQKTSNNDDTSKQSNPDEGEEEFKFGDVAEYDCEYGYALMGPQALYCSKDGIWVWSSRHSRWPGLEYAPRYYPSHEWPHSNDNSQLQNSSSDVPRPPVCLPVRCPTPPSPLNGGFVYRKTVTNPSTRNKHLDQPEAYFVGDEVLNTCKDEDESETFPSKRRQMVGPRLRRCLPSGQWSSYRPRCKDL